MYPTDNLPYEKVGKNEPVCIAEEVPFDIPETWEWVRLGEIYQHNTGKALNASNRSGELLTYITTSNLYWNRFEIDSLREMYFSESEIEKCTATKGDLLVCEGGDIGRAAIWLYDTDIRIQNHIHRLRPYSEICTEYYYYIFFLYKHAGWIGGKGIGIQGLSSNALHALLFPLPPLSEQYRIITKIKEIEPFLDKYAQAEKRLNNLNTQFPDLLKKSILQEAVQGKLVPQDPADEPASILLERIRAEKEQMIKAGKIKRDKHESVIFRRDNSHYEKRGSEEVCIDEELPFEIPRNWEWCYLGDVAFVTKLAGFEYTKYIAPNLTDTGIPLFKGKNVQNGKLVFNFEGYIPEYLSDELSRSQISKKCLLTPYVGTIGNIAIFDGRFKAHLGSNVGKIELINPVNRTYLSEEYVLNYLRSPAGYQQLTKHKKATAQESISIDAIRNVIMPIPPTNEQNRIINMLTGLERKVQAL